MEDVRYDCVKLAVDCTISNQVSIPCGNPKILGFDFYIKEKDIKDISKFIVLALQQFEVPLMKIGVTEKLQLREYNLCTKEEILRSIRSQADLIKAEAKKKH